MNRHRPTSSPISHLSTAVFGLVFLAAAACGSASDSSGDSLSADAGADIDVAVGESPAFDGCGSSGDITNYRWTIREAPASMPDDVGKAIRESMSQCSFTLEASMIADEVGSWTIELLVTDADGTTNSDTVTVNVTP